jgi:ribulose-5-phosphate 4-epimerase/fuculose-1-phosphate aldolase
MPNFTLEFSKVWIEHGIATVEASDIVEARDMADEMLESCDDSIEWSREASGEESVDKVTEE